ncbi:right-handed parallel beta-helix repeat-containing protein [Nitrospira sp. Kam-Ns4a]
MPSDHPERLPDREEPASDPTQAAEAPPLRDPPPNPAGGRTLIVDPHDPTAFSLPSAALEAAGPDDQIFIRPGLYEDKLFIVERRILLIGAGRDQVRIFSRRGGPLYLQRVTGGRISGITFRYVGSDQHSAVNVLDSVCTISHCRAMDGVLSSMVLYGPHCRPSVVDNEVCGSRESGIFVFAGACPYVAQNHCHDNHHFGIAVRDPGSRPDLVRNVCRANLLSGMLLFHHAAAMVLDNTCQDNDHWGTGRHA